MNLIKKAWRWIICLFSPKSRAKIALQKRQVAIIVGHNAKEQGALNYKGESEWSFNKRIAQKLKTELAGRGISSQVIFRLSDASYKEQVKTVSGIVDETDAQTVLSLHFNAFKEPVLGCECLWSGSAYSQDLGLSIASQLNRRLNITLRHHKGTKEIYDGHSGHAMLKALSKRGRSVCLVEPCFGNTKNHDSFKIFENEGTYVLCLSNAIRSHLKTLTT